jgi:hypothetical protein
MSDAGSQLSNPFSTGGGGVLFESQVQACYAALMLTDGFAPGLQRWPIKKIRLQARIAGYHTDDLVVFVESPDGTRHQRMLGQIKHSIAITKGDRTFGEVIQAAWNDFNNSRLFSRDSDAIALITGPLSKTDVSDTREMLEWARTSDDVDDFAMKVNSTNFSNETKRQKLDAFRVQLKRANNGTEIPDNDVFRFLRCFYLLGYDLDFRPGVVASLLDSLISPSSHYGAQSLWDRIVGEVQHVNMTAGALDKETLQERLGDSFQPLHIETIPPELLARPSEPSEEVPAVVSRDWNRHTYASELVIADLVGSWDENREGDISTICRLAGSDYGTWISGIREVLQEADSPVALRNGIWSVPKRYDLWQALGGRIFDTSLTLMAEVALSVFAERDPQFDLSPGKRFAASVYGKTLTHSPQLRKGLAETLALLGSHPQALVSCSTGRAEGTARLAVRSILGGAGWERWASLNDILPLIAEAAPAEFLDIVDRALQMSPCPFDGVFAQEGEDLLAGRNYMTGFLWGLEGIAWNRDYFARAVGVLGELASRDPGGRSANRPASSLVTILLPWFPQTAAPFAQRKVAVEILCRKQPRVGWNVLLALLPKMHQVSTHSYRPVWQTTWIPENWHDGVTKADYWTAASVYAKLAVAMAKKDLARLTELLEHLHSLPLQALKKVLGHLSSTAIVSLPEKERVLLWNRLMKSVSDNREGWTGALLLDVKETADRLAPTSPFYSHQRLFTERVFELLDGEGSFEEQHQRLDQQQQEAAREVYQADGYEGLLKFVHAVEAPYRVGLALGGYADDTIDAQVLPSLLNSNDLVLEQFLSGFVWRRYAVQNGQWADALNTQRWTADQKAQFLAYLPFAPETWGRVFVWLKDDESRYWAKTAANPYGANNELAEASNNLLRFGRPLAAARCLEHMVLEKKAIDSQQTIRVLKAVAQSSEKRYQSDGNTIATLIGMLQQDPKVNRGDIATIEWMFLLLLDGSLGTQHKTLDRELAEDPAFFCDVVQKVFSSDKEKGGNRSMNEQQKQMAENGYRLLDEWQIPPGLHENGTFHGGELSSWLKRTKKTCMKSGHLGVAMSIVGQVLFHVPPDPGGLWINKAAAKVLDKNGEEAEHLRSGYSVAVANSRGAYWVDRSGKDEQALAAKYRGQAHELDMHGYFRLEATIQAIAERYDLEAEEVMSRHEMDE